MRHYFILLLCALSLLAGRNVFGQMNNIGLELRQELQDSSSQVLKLEIANQNFLRNNEYFSELLTGYTLFGSLLQTKLSYQLHPHWKLSAGLFIRKDFGHKGLYALEPMLSLKYQGKSVSVIMGNLEGNVNHRLIEPLFNYERFITHNQENGLQCIVNRKTIWSDTWVNWETMQYNQSDYQEQFTAGHSSILTLFKRKKHEVKGVVQGLISHRGGQIDTDTSAMQSHASAALGFTYSYSFNQFIKEYSMQHYGLYSSFLNAPASNDFKTGFAWYSTVQCTTRYHVGLSLSYWQGSTFQASRGGDLFQSFSSIYTQKPSVQKQRQLAIARLFYQKEIIPNVYADVRFEPYYDLNQSLFEYAYGVYLTYKKDFVLLNEKNRQKK